MMLMMAATCVILPRGEQVAPTSEREGSDELPPGDAAAMEEVRGVSEEQLHSTPPAPRTSTPHHAPHRSPREAIIIIIAS